MMTSGQLSSTALGWVRQDLDREMEKVRMQVESIAGNPDTGAAVLEGTAERLDELNLIFETLVLDGARQITGEMHRLVRKLGNGGIEDREAANAALMEATVILPGYLDRLQAGHQDLPLLLLPLINRMRASVGEEPLSEGTVFTPMLDVELPEVDRVRQPGADEPLEYLTGHLHRQYEVPMQRWLRQQDDLSLLLPMQGICETLCERVRRYDLKRLWWVATEVFGGLMDGHIANDIHLRRLLARLSRMIRTLSQEGEDGVDERTSTSVTQALLYHVSNAEPGCDAVDLVRERFRLDALAADSDAMMRAQGTLAGRDRDMYRSLSAAVEDELAIVKEALEEERRSGEVDEERRHQSMEALRRLGDTLGMLGLSGPGQEIIGLVPRFEETERAEATEREAALGVLAERLLLVESTLNEQIESLCAEVDEDESEKGRFIALSRHEQRQIRARLLDECVRSMHVAEDAVRERLGGEAEPNPDEPLVLISGALRMAGEEGTAELTERLTDTVMNLLGDPRYENDIEQSSKETMAEAMAGLELYLSAIRDGQQNAERLLDGVRERLDRLAESAAAREAEVVALETVPAWQGTVQNEEPSSTYGEDAPAEDEPRETATVVDAFDTAPKTDAEAAATEENDLPAEIDPELREIFLEEYEDVLQSLQVAIPTWINQLDHVDALTDIRRAFHTLKGSGRMVGADELGDFSWQIENMLNSVLEGRTRNFVDASVMVRLAEASLPALRQRLLQEHAGIDGQTVLAINQVAEQVSRDEPADWASLRAHLPVYLAGLLPGGLDDAGDAEAEDAPSDEMNEMLKAELAEHLETLRGLMDAITQDRSTRTGEEHVRAAHTLAGALAMKEEGLDAEVAGALEGLLEAQSRTGAGFTPVGLFTVISAVGQLQNRLDRLYGAGELSGEDEQRELIDQLRSLTSEFGADAESRAPADEPEAIDPEGHFDAGEHDAGEAEAFDLSRSEFAGAPESGDDSGSEPAPVPPLPETPQAPPASAPPGFEAPKEAAASTLAPRDPLSAEADESPDPEIVAIFLEEAADVLERADGALNQWRDDLNERKWVKELQREIHTFKGGARMAGLIGVGDFAHELEGLLERIAEGLQSPSLSAVQVLEDGGDHLHAWVKDIERGNLPATQGALDLLRQQVQGLDAAPDAAPEIQPPVEPEEPAEAVDPHDSEPAEPAAAPPVGTPLETGAATDEADQEEPGGGRSIKVAPELLDRLVNASGEVSIFRSRLEQQLAKLKANVSDFDETIDRLSEQFRKMDIEIETQIRAKYPNDLEVHGDNFDPLELDQFSALQQATRSLQETVADLQSLREMAAINLHASEQLLTRQSRVSTELQEGLMKTRMVPFGTIAPRLRRIVRGAAKDEGKRARLQLRMVGASDELDRNVLEHITAPLEHMMRNAVAHGIEDPERRRELGKAEEGEITVTVESEATEFVIRIADDGAGIDLDAIRHRAVERGLLDEHAEPTRQQLHAFMMDSGFSTSSAVTRVAGRGVGMDVVNSDIKQIGGSLEIDSEPDKGTQFTIRIPFTLAIMKAIGLIAGEASYLLPLSSVVGVSRIQPDDYRTLIEGEEPVYSFAGQEYPVRDIETMLGERPTPLGRNTVSLLILRAGEHRAALRVPELLPHREVVIKPVGPQISSVPGVLGGSISGDGEVMVILDPGPMIRRALVRDLSAPSEQSYAPPTNQRKLVLVVDDSITMRKVTSRVLESREYDVMTARDGVDALEQLEDRTPDIMLLDIEMPRMDGYELTERVRDDARFRRTPIMMITSRAGQKHRDRAMQAGATEYLTKPYREDQLLRKVEHLLDEASR